MFTFQRTRQKSLQVPNLHPYTIQLPTSHAQFLEFSNLRQQSELDGMTCQVNAFQFLQSEMYLVFN